MDQGQTAIAGRQAGGDATGMDTGPRHFPCSFAQERLWLLGQLDPTSPALNVAVTWRLSGPLCAETLECAVQAVVARHEILRTSFPEIDGEPVQVVHEAIRVPLRVAELASWPETGRALELSRLGQAEAIEPFNLEAPPLIRTTLVRMAPMEAILFVTAHHMVFDGWSIGVLAHEIGAAYEAFSQGCTPILPELEIQYGDYALWQKAWTQSKEFDAVCDFWTRQLQGCPYFTMPADHKRPAANSHRGALTSVLLPRALTDAAEATARLRNTTFFTVALTALAALLHRHTGQVDIAVGTQVAGRDQLELEPLIGPLINSLALRVDLSGDPTLPDLLDRAKATVLDALEHHAMPFDWLIRLLNPARDLGRNPLFSVNLIVQRAFAKEARYGPIELRGLPSHSSGALFDLNFALVERPEGWRANCEYNTDLFDAATVDRFLSDWQEIMGLMGRNTAPRLRTLRARRTDVEQRLTEIWERLLGVQPIGPDENFFELGGHSLLAARMFAAVRDTFGTSSRLAELYRFPTIETLARAIAVAPEPEMAPQFSFQILQAAGDGAPVVAINNFAVFHPLARKLGGRQPFISVYLTDPDRSRALPDRALQQTAAEYLKVLRQAQPHGPYVVLGWCVSGNIAFEVAQQLRRAGEEVPLVVMIDTWAPDHRQRVGKLRGLLAATSYRVQWRYTEWRSGRRRLVDMLFRSKRAGSRRQIRDGYPHDAIAPDHDSRYDWYIDYLSAAAARYRPQPYDGSVLLIRTSDEPAGWFLDKQFGWGGIVTGPITIREAPGSHLSVFRHPHVEQLAGCIGEALSQLRRPAA